MTDDSAPPPRSARRKVRRALGVRRAVAESAAALEDLVLPVDCPCGAAGTRLCSDCAAALTAEPYSCERRADRLMRTTWSAGIGPARAGVALAPLARVMAVTAYADPVATIILTCKHRGRLDLTRDLGHALAGAVGALVRDNGARGAGEHAAAPAAGKAAMARATGPIVLVPIPSTLRARLRRGDDHTELMARFAARSASTQDLVAGRRVLVARLLRARWGGRSQVGRNASDRSRNRRGAFAPRTRRLNALERRSPGARLVIVDDVVTTGATIAAACDVLAEAGVCSAEAHPALSAGSAAPLLVGAAVVAATRPAARARRATDTLRPLPDPPCGR